MWKFIKTNWQQAFFALVGLAFLTFSFRQLVMGDIAGSSATFAMSFFSFFYSNIARFKRFKGLGFEAELWDDKKKEAEDLIKRLNTITSSFSKEILLGKVKQNRFTSGPEWKNHWKLFDELKGAHEDLGQTIDLSETKRQMDVYFIFDITSELYPKLGDAVSIARVDAERKIKREFPEPIQNAAEYGARRQQLREIPENIKDLFSIAEKDDLARYIIDWGLKAKNVLEQNFDITIEFDEKTLNDLQYVSEEYQKGPLQVSDRLIELSESR
ncbi:hypothetical protein [Celeribacter naphthalenivorans]|uniref:hypothetical protein n=1 Tax=Celeribacter naphthalenivorans TaxID=1614694 RepID=UPI001CF97B26|nr:hypothetical protein [Celeribacter naphthalenivorans]